MKFQIKAYFETFYNLVTINGGVCYTAPLPTLATDGKDVYLYSKIHWWVR